MYAARSKVALLSLSISAILAGCASQPESVKSAQAPAPLPSTPIAVVPPIAIPLPTPSSARTIEEYKHQLALHIGSASVTRMYTHQPQPLLRSVVVLRYEVDARGHVIRSEIMRSNRDRETETTALAALHGAAPFPPPGPHLLNGGRLELSETWLFNSDGRFQLRTTALPQARR